jgi:large subunit ribosomal protein L14e
MLEVGRLCLKTAGREAGRYCVVVKPMDENFVMVTGPKDLTSVKRRRCNVNHLEPVMEVLKINSDAPDSEVLKAFQSANLVTKLGLETGKPKPAGKAVPEKPKADKARKEKPAEKKEKAKPKKSSRIRGVLSKKKPPARKAEPKKSKPKPKKAEPKKKPAKAKPKKAAKKK